ncbi:PREDICTED: UPF0481 protein At3g47200-like [Ipomoea nil]|uniref:UPF0481 protein At3g47200-like n=1 Tax=Ipomoea nil TaxID=35883 RepID=UPI00090128E9|nr:PREDICTED: UPF0481 protein At3g47200-like [Ipomoea nil]
MMRAPPPIAAAAGRFLHEIDREYGGELFRHDDHVIININEEGGEEWEVGGGGGDDDIINNIPRLVSIGPNHYGNPSLSKMETHKTNLLHLQSRKWNSHMEPSLRMALQGLEGRARNCYPPHISNHLDRDTFVNMMLIDSFFLINLFMDYAKFCKGGDGGLLNNNGVFRGRRVLPKISQDLLMLKNQLPFFILAKVYVILTNNQSSPDSLKKLALQFFKQLVPFGKVAIIMADNNDDSSSPKTPKHLLDLFHSSFANVGRQEHNITSSSSSKHKMEETTKFWVNSASTLRSNGVTFAGTKSGKPLDIQFSSWLGELRIPTFCIDDKNIIVLKNLLAYEQSSREVKPYFTCLAVFFSNIAATKGDVKILREAGIIRHHLGNDEKVVGLFHELYNTIECSSRDDCLIKCQLHRINRYVTSVPCKFISYPKRILANPVHLVVFFVALLFSLPPDTFEHSKIRV